MEFPLYQVDAFASQLFAGNPAAVVPLPGWIPDNIMQQIAAENNLPETAFVVHEDDHYLIRWFTPTVEVDLCGHATMAAAYVLHKFEACPMNPVTFINRRGDQLLVVGNGDEYTLDFPVLHVNTCSISRLLIDSLGATPKEALLGEHLVAIFDNEDDIINIKPDLFHIAQLPCRGIVITAPGNDVDYVCRFFAPQSGIDEDQVTGSAQTKIAPLWSERLGKTTLTARQLSPRGGEMTCEVLGDRVLITGKVVPYLRGHIAIK